MSSTEQPASAAAAPGRKAASWFNAIVLALALTACCVLAVLMTTRAHKRFDVTATRQHDLTPRTHQLLDRLDRDLTLVVAADLSTLDHSTRQRTLDVLERFSSASKRLKVNLINTSDAAGQQSYEQVLSGLIQRDKPTIDAATAAVTAAAVKSEAVAATLDSIQQTLLKLKDELVAGTEGMLNSQYLQTQAAVFRVAVQDLRVGANNAKAHTTSADPMVPVPAIDKALAELKKPVGDASRALTILGDAFDSLAKDARASEKDKAAAGLLLPMLRTGRDAAGTLSADLEAVAMPRILLVARALQVRRAALLIDDGTKPGGGVGGGIGVQPIDADTLLAVGEQGVDLRARTEDLIAGAIARMSSGIRPVVCIVHGAPTRLTSQGWPLLQRVGEQLSMRGVEMIEWPVAIEREMPAKVAVDTASRPVVFVTITAQGGSREGAQNAAAGIAAFSKALDTLVATGRNVLLSVNLSQVPASGSPDPLTECLKPLGIEVDSGRPLLQSDKVETRMVARSRQDILDPHATHAISGAISGLRLRLQWPLTISAAKAATHVRVEPIVAMPADGSLWVESEWQEFYRAVSQSKGDYTRIANPPAKDSPRDGSAGGGDGAGGGGGAWMLAAAVENSAPDRPRQRLVVVGANGWFLDDLVDVQANFDGRVAPVFPGNLQLLESSVHWLAGQDDQILRGATASSSATIPVLSNAAQAWLRWLLIAIMPALALAAGVAYRVLRP